MKRLIKAGLLIDGTGKKPLANAIIALEGDLIKEVGPAESFSRESLDGEVLDLSHCAILPGLIDCHVHLFLEGIFDLSERGVRWKESKEITLIRAMKNLQQTLQRGVTTVRDLGGPDKINLLLKKSVNKGIIHGPRVITSGQAISITGGHFHYGGGWEADGPSEMVKAVREQVKAGADLIKIMMTGCVNFVREDAGCVELSPEETEVLVREAHRLGKRIAVHANGPLGIAQALESGVDTIEHGALLDLEMVKRISQKGVYWVPTLMPFQRMLDYSLQYACPSLPQGGIERVYTKHKEMVKAGVKLGAKVLAGTDAGALGVEHGDLVGELKLLVENEIFTPEEAIRAATFQAAEALGWEKKIGTLEPGKKADIIGVRGNPLQDVGDLAKVTAVLKDGVLIHLFN